MFNHSLTEIVLFCLLNAAWGLIYHRSCRSFRRRLKQAQAERDVERAYTTKVQADIHQLMVRSEALMANNERLTQLAERKDEVFDRMLLLTDQALSQLADQQPVVERYNQLLQLRQRLSEN